MDRFAKAIAEIGTTPQAKAVLIEMSTPGGTVAGTSDAWRSLTELSKSKPTLVLGRDLVASAGYHIAVGARHLWSPEEVTWGSIGTYMQVLDSSKAAANQGYQVRIVKAGAFKGMGTRGTEITAEQLNELQRHVNDLNSVFVQHVATGRQKSLEHVREQWNTGQDWLAVEAQKMGLIDQVGTREEALLWLKSQVTNPVSVTSPGLKASTQEKKAMPLSPKDIMAACKGIDSKADAAWILEQSLRDDLTDAVQVKDAWTEHIQAKAKAALEASEKSRLDAEAQHQKKLDALQAEFEKTRQDQDDDRDSQQLKPGGNKTVEAGDKIQTVSEGMRLVQDHPFAVKLEQAVKAGETRDQAMVSCMQADPQGYRDWLRQTSIANSKMRQANSLSSSIFED